MKIPIFSSFLSVLQRQGYISDSEFGDTRSIESSISELSTGHFQMPFEMVREGIETSLRQKWQKLRDHIQQIEKENRENQEGGGGGGGGGGGKDGTGSAGEDGKSGEGGGGGGGSGPKDAEIENLRRKLETYHDIIVQQEQVLQVFHSPDLIPSCFELLIF